MTTMKSTQLRTKALRLATAGRNRRNPIGYPLGGAVPREKPPIDNYRLLIAGQYYRLRTALRPTPEEQAAYEKQVDFKAPTEGHILTPRRAPKGSYLIDRITRERPPVALSARRSIRPRAVDSLMKIGDKMLCELLDAFNKPTGAFQPVEIREISRHWQTGEPISCRVKYRRKGVERYIWAQAGMLSR